MAKALCAARADVFATASNGKTPLEIAHLNSKRGSSPVLELLQHAVAAAVLDMAYSRPT